MEKKLYFECTSGISGDMTVAALLDLGADEKVLREAIESIPATGFDIKISRVKKSGLDACDFDVLLDEKHENHDHDMEYLHGHSQEHSHEHHHEHNHGEHLHEHDHGEHSHEHNHGEHPHAHSQDHNHGEHSHTHAHDHSHSHSHSHHGHHHHEHRGLPDILAMIDQCKMTDSARKLAKKIFDIVAEAEAKAHGLPKDQVHFHEVGAIDSIVDIVAVAVCFDNIGINDVIIPVLYEGSGSVRCQHGILPVPVPATANIVERHGLKLHKMDFMGEFVTPTGAAIAAALKTEEKLPDCFKIKKTGIGAGKRAYEKASLLRVMIIEVEKDENKDFIYKLETNIDDCTGENLGFVMEKLFLAGAKDVSYLPVYMKKNRPAYELHIICEEKDIEAMEQILFEETTTIGIRKIKMERSILKREERKIESEYGEFRVKVCKLKEGERVYLEYEDVAKLAKQNHIPYPKMCQILWKEV